MILIFLILLYYLTQKYRIGQLGWIWARQVAVLGGAVSKSNQDTRFALRIISNQVCNLLITIESLHWMTIFDRDVISSVLCYSHVIAFLMTRQLDLIEDATISQFLYCDICNKYNMNSQERAVSYKVLWQ